MNKEFEKAMSDEAIALAECAETIAQMSETMAAMRLAQEGGDKRIIKSLKQSHSIISQVVQSLYDVKNK